MKKAIIILLLFLAFTKVDGQLLLSPNLVQNPSFEDYSSCPVNSGELNKATHWWGYSTDYFNSCAPSGWMSVPNNVGGYQNANSGIAYAGFLLYWHTPTMPNNASYIESIKNMLGDTLKKNNRYCINYYISLAEHTFKIAQAANCPVIYDSIGALFSTNQIPDNTSEIHGDTYANFAKSILGLDTLNWFKISGSVVAKGGEKYLTLGKINTVNWANGIWCEFYIYIDDVSVCECSFEFSLGRDTTLCDGETLLLNPNMPNTIYTWQDSSHAATYSITKPGTYWVRAYFPDYGITTSSSINVNFDGECLKIPNVITPNGDGKNDNFVIENSEGWNIDIQIFNRWGAIVYQNNTYKNTWNGKDVADGVYYYIIKATNNYSGIKKEYKGSVTVMR